MKKIITYMLILSCFAGLQVAQAATDREAVRICSAMRFNSSKDECYEKIRQYRNHYFDENAINLCVSFDFDSSRVSCVDAIVSKRYRDYEISHCRSQRFDSSRLECLERSGEIYENRPRPPVYEDPYQEDYARGVFSRWEKVGGFTAPKALTETYEISLNPDLGVTDVQIKVTQAQVKIVKATAVTASGRTLELTHLEGDTGKNGVKTFKLHPRYALRLQKITIEATSPSLIGSRGQFEFFVGLTR